MAEGLATADGTAIDLDKAEQDFHRAMAAPEPDEPEAPAPPKREPADPDAPFGRKLDGTPKKAPGGRPGKPRVTESTPAAQTASKPSGKPGQAGTQTDYAQPLGDFTSAVWMVMAAAPVPNDGLRLKIRAQAKILKDNQPGLCQGINLMAQHNGTIRRGVEALTMGQAGWVLPAVMAVAPFAVQSAQLWRTDPGQLAGMAADTEREWADQFAAMQAAMGLAEPEGHPAPPTAEELAAEREFYEQHGAMAA
jgi:hypothetical protein